MNSLAIESAGLYAVEPIKDCPHCEPANIRSLEALLAQGVTVNTPCKQCPYQGEVWLCLSCGEVHCSRYVQGHMSSHNAETGHPIALSFADFSYWCYTCDSYVVHELLDHHSQARPDGFYRQKFGDDS